MGRRLTGAFVAIVGVGMLLGSVYTSVCLNVPVLNVGLALCGTATIFVGFTINYCVVRRRVSKRGHFDW